MTNPAGQKALEEIELAQDAAEYNQWDIAIEKLERASALAHRAQLREEKDGKD